MTNLESTYYFIGKFEPYEECKNFNPGELDLGDGWILDIYLDLVCIWNSKVSRPFNEVNPFINRALALVSALFIFRSKLIVDHRVSHWIEAKEVSSAINIIGTIVSKVSQPNRRARINTHWKKAAFIFPQVMSNQLVRLSLKDYISALKDGGDDSFFYAYRSIENICRFISGAKGDLKTNHWNKMNTSLETDKSFIDPLTSVAKDIRHGNFEGNSLVYARKHRKQLLDISRTLLTNTFNIHFKNYL